MNILILDTETNGLPKDWGAKPERFDLFPEILSIAFITWNTETDETLEHYYVIDRPIGKFDEYAQNVHDFNEKRLKDEGTSFLNMHIELDVVLERADLIVCHNVGFDLPILQSDIIRNKLDLFNLGELPTYCTMKSTTDLCKIEGAYTSFKWPKLPELYLHLFGLNMEDKYKAHNALEDAKCTLECLKELVKMGWVDFDQIVSKNIYL